MALRLMLAQGPRRQGMACGGGAFTAREEERLAAMRWTIADGQGWFSLEDSARSRLEEAVVARLADVAYGVLVPPTEEAATVGRTRFRPVLPDNLVKGAISTVDHVLLLHLKRCSRVQRFGGRAQTQDRGESLASRRPGRPRGVRARGDEGVQGRGWGWLFCGIQSV
jgi:hypothetical protein